MKWTVPNILTTLRLLAAPGIALMFLLLPRPAADWAALVLFTVTALTDWVDGYLARLWRQETKMGAMLDPIADKAMVVIALMVLAAFSSLAVWLIVPAALILFREVFVSGLREYLGDTAGTLKVTKLAKWKTTVQMVAISVLLAHGILEHYFRMWTWGMDDTIVGAVLTGAEEDVLGIRPTWQAMVWAAQGGLVLIWVAAALTLITGGDYLRKALPRLKEDA